MKDRLIDAWLAPRLMVLYAYREVGGDVATLSIGQVVRRSEIWLAASKDVSDQEAGRWQSGFEQLRADGTYDAILARYARLRPEPVPEDRRAAEIQWVNCSPAEIARCPDRPAKAAHDEPGGTLRNDYRYASTP